MANERMEHVGIVVDDLAGAIEFFALLGLERSYGKVVNEVADEYDRHRPTYPDVLLDHVCEVGALGAGDRVLEVGCGTGQLIRALHARGGARVGDRARERLIALARRPSRAWVAWSS